MSDAIQKPYTSYTCIKHVKAEGRFKGDFLIEQTSLIPLGLNKHRLNTCNYAIYKSRISRDRVLLISDRYYIILGHQKLKHFTLTCYINGGIVA